MSGLADIASILTAGATCVALVFAGLELRRSRLEDQRRRRVEIEGVAVSWVPDRAPRAPQDAQGRATWVYKFTAFNPGSLPVSDVRVEVQFGVNVQRLRYDGYCDEPADKIRLGTPVIAGGGERAWTRSLVMDYAEGAAALPSTQAVISFTDPDDPGRTQRNTWPKRVAVADARHADLPVGSPSGNGGGSPRPGGSRS